MSKFFKKFWKEEKGQGMVEYALIIGLVAVVLILVIPGMTDSIEAVFNSIKTSLTGVTTP